MNERDPDAEILKEYERRQVDGTDLEGLQPIGANVSPNARAAFSLRLSREEFQRFNAEARARHMTLAAFLRSSAWAAISGETDPGKAAAVAEVRQKLKELSEVAGRL
jgi:hypothetical protein